MSAIVWRWSRRRRTWLLVRVDSTRWDYAGWLFIPPGLGCMGMFLYLSLLRHLSRPMPDDITTC